MRKLLLLLLLPAVCMAQRSTYGTGKNTAGKFSLGVGADFILPITTTFKDAYNVGYGGNASAEYAFTDNLTGMLRVGYDVLTGKEVFPGVTLENGSMVPAVVGLKYYFMPGTLRFYGAFDVGVTWFTQSSVGVNILGQNIGLPSATTTEFTWEPQLGLLGYFSNSAAFDIGVRWIGISNANALGIRFGVLFDFGGGSASAY